MPMNDQRLTLLCFSYAGGSAAIYSRWGRLLPGIEVVAVDLPGRGLASQATPLVSREALIDYLLGHYGHFCVGRFALFGHSLGARIAFEFLLVLERVSGFRAMALFISGCLAPERFSQAMRLRECDTSDAALLEMLAGLGGTPPELIADPARLSGVLPLIRADFRLAIDLSKALRGTVSAPIQLLLGSRDKVTCLFQDYPGWARHTACTCQVSVIDGDHFFIRSQFKRVATVVGQILRGAPDEE